MCYLVVLWGSRVEGPSQKELRYHTAKRPHVYGLTERQAQDDLRSPAEKKHIVFVRQQKDQQVRAWTLTFLLQCIKCIRSYSAIIGLFCDWQRHNRDMTTMTCTLSAKEWEELIFTLHMSSWRAAQCSKRRSEEEIIYAAYVGVSWRLSTNFNIVPKADTLLIKQQPHTNKLHIFTHKHTDIVLRFHTKTEFY